MNKDLNLLSIPFRTEKIRKSLCAQDVSVKYINTTSFTPLFKPEG